MEMIVTALLDLLSPNHLLFLILGVVIGLSVGLLPGLGGIAGLSLVLPFVFGMDPADALAIMIGLTSVTTTSDTFPAVLMGVPGTAGSQATVLDGFPLAKNGQAARALSAAFASSLFGGVFGAIVLTGAVFAAKPIILSFGFGEQLMLVILALTMIGMLTGESAMKGLAACGIGLLLGAIGTAFTTGQMRMAFDLLYFTDGVPLIIVGLGMFAVPEIVDLLRRQQTISETGQLGVGWIQGLKDFFRHKWIALRCAGLGALVGILPGLGGSVVDWIAYGHIVQVSKDRDNFGKGDIRGVVAPESANNAKEGGALVPTLLFGIPGSGGMALLLGGLILVGIEPGPSMVNDHLDLTFTIIWSIALANVFGAGICLALARPISLLTTLRYATIAPLMIAIIFFAAYQANNDWGDVVALLVLSALGIFMKRFGWSRPGLLIGFVLSDKVEDAIYQTVQAYGFELFARPIVLVLLALVVLSVIVALRTRRTTSDLQTNPRYSATHKGPQLAFLGALAAFTLWAIVDSWPRVFSMSVFPLTVGALTCVPLLILAAGMLRARQPGVMLFDADKDASLRRRNAPGDLYYLGWMAALLLASALLGFVVAVTLFIIIFLRHQARASYTLCITLALAFLLLLAVFAQALVLEYPTGLLQNYVPLPWPFAI
jgi:putative tricarboxylic transport membrane protein